MSAFFTALHPSIIEPKIITNGPFNSRSTGAVLIGYTENNGKSFYPNLVRIVSLSATLITVNATISFGTNASSYNNILTATLLVNLASINKYVNLFVTSAISIIPPNTPIYMNISIGAIGTEQSYRIDIIGDYV